ncbi:MAG: YlbF family regulator [Epulopiscium sp.]|jgi:cell fate (sporulation/competence/biofilm development) regulator YlbF (YheA/YmcA/DUF963 family)|nr:YlbF family regulator [Candidatus Epulonipiscium sp.]
MASVYELARQLGEEMLKTPEVEALLEAKKNFEADGKIAQLVQEYTELQKAFETKYAAGQTTPEEQEAFTKDMTARGNVIKENKAAAALFTAEMRFNQYMNSIFSIITSTIAGEDTSQEGCDCSSGGCSSCSGCH